MDWIIFRVVSQIDGWKKQLSIFRSSNSTILEEEASPFLDRSAKRVRVQHQISNWGDLIQWLDGLRMAQILTMVSRNAKNYLSFSFLLAWLLESRFWLAFAIIFRATSEASRKYTRILGETKIWICPINRCRSWFIAGGTRWRGRFFFWFENWKADIEYAIQTRVFVLDAKSALSTCFGRRTVLKRRSKECFAPNCSNLALKRLR